MNESPTTRPSLVVRIRDPHDERAWSEFMEIYEPLVYRLARRRGFQHADAAELTQQVFVAVASAVERWEPDPERGSFRGWLFRIARNLMVNYLTRQRRHPRGTGDTGLQQLLEALPSPGEESDEFEEEYRRQVFAWAAEQTERELHENTWKAFWLTNVEGHNIKSVAGRLGMTPGAVYAARSRVMARIRKKIEGLESD